MYIIGNVQHLELCSEANRQLVQLAKQRFYMVLLRHLSLHAVLKVSE